MHRQKHGISEGFATPPQDAAFSYRDVFLCTFCPRLAGNPRTLSQPRLYMTNEGKLLYIVIIVVELFCASGGVVGGLFGRLGALKNCRVNGRMLGYQH